MSSGQKGLDPVVHVCLDSYSCEFRSNPSFHTLSNVFVTSKKMASTFFSLKRNPRYPGLDLIVSTSAFSESWLTAIEQMICFKVVKKTSINNLFPLFSLSSLGDLLVCIWFYTFFFFFFFFFRIGIISASFHSSGKTDCSQD